MILLLFSDRRHVQPAHSARIARERPRNPGTWMPNGVFASWLLVTQLRVPLSEDDWSRLMSVMRARGSRQSRGCVLLEVSVRIFHCTGMLRQFGRSGQANLDEERQCRLRARLLPLQVVPKEVKAALFFKAAEHIGDPTFRCKVIDQARVPCTFS